MKVAIIGSGGIAARHLEVLALEQDVEIVGHVTRTPEHAQAATARWGGRAYATTEELLREEDVDVTWICVPPYVHGEIEEQLLARRIPFFVEKPIDADCSTAERIAEGVQRAGIVAGVAYHWRAMDAIPLVRRTLRENPARMVLGAWHSSTPGVAWWRRQEYSGGQIVEQATHLFDLARYLLGEADVVSAIAARHERPRYPDADVADTSAALLRFGGDVTGVFTATCLLRGTPTVQLQIVCEGLQITVSQEGVIYDKFGIRQVRATDADPFVEEDRAFLAAVRRTDPSLLFCTYEDALQTQRLCCAVREAAQGS